MKTLFKAIAVASLATATAAQAELSASVAVDSSYIFRGLEMDGSNTASVTVEYEVAGFTIGAWIADANEAGFVETDLSLSYTAAIAGHDVTISYVDFAYDYDGDSLLDDQSNQEISISTSISGLGISYTDGSATVTNTDVNPNVNVDGDYDVLTVDYTLGNTNILLGNVRIDDAAEDYSYFEISNDVGQVAGLDVSLSYIGTFSEDGGDGDNNAFVIGLSKGFDL